MSLNFIASQRIGWAKRLAILHGKRLRRHGLKAVKRTPHLLVKIHYRFAKAKVSQSRVVYSHFGPEKHPNFPGHLQRLFTKICKNFCVATAGTGQGAGAEAAGVREAAAGGMAGGSRTRAGTGDRRRPASRGKGGSDMGGDGVRAQRPQRRARPRPSGRDGRCVVRAPRSAAAGDLPRRGGAAGGLQVPVQPEDRRAGHP